MANGIAKFIKYPCYYASLIVLRFKTRNPLHWMLVVSPSSIHYASLIVLCFKTRNPLHWTLWWFLLHLSINFHHYLSFVSFDVGCIMFILPLFRIYENYKTFILCLTETSFHHKYAKVLMYPRKTWTQHYHYFACYRDSMHY